MRLGLNNTNSLDSLGEFVQFGNRAGKTTARRQASEAGFLARSAWLPTKPNHMTNTQPGVTAHAKEIEELDKKLVEALRLRDQAVALINEADAEIQELHHRRNEVKARLDRAFHG